jgi:hypothetical protein
VSQSAEEALAKMRLALMGLIEGFDTFTDAVTGFRTKLEAAGYSPTMAEQLAGELHRQLIIHAFETMKASHD